MGFPSAGESAVSASASSSSSFPPPLSTPTAVSYSRGALLSQCAESKIYECDFFGTPAICKHRFEKQYRHPKLDRKIRDQRTVREARALAKCAMLGIRVPDVYAVHRETCEIIMERIPGSTVKEVLDVECGARRSASLLLSPHRSREKVAPPPLPLFSFLVYQLLEGIGEVMGLLHSNGIIHGDLTTSNFLYVPSHHRAVNTLEEEKEAEDRRRRANATKQARGGLVVIDFGLITEKVTDEDRAVDFYVLIRAILCTHPTLEPVAEESIITGYRRTANPKMADSTLKRLEVVRARGRKKCMVG